MVGLNRCNLDRWMSYNPLRGEPEQQRTSVWIGYDNEAIYFAFRCYDDEPDKIRSTISRRDNVWNDDWVGVSLDSSRAGQIAYHMFVNPSGIQMDALQSANEDTSPDWLWQSAGRVDAEGYVVEIRLAASEHQIQGRQRRADGHALLPEEQPAGRLLVVARDEAG